MQQIVKMYAYESSQVEEVVLLSLQWQPCLSFMAGFLPFQYLRIDTLKAPIKCTVRMDRIILSQLLTAIKPVIYLQNGGN